MSDERGELEQEIARFGARKAANAARHGAGALAEIEAMSAPVFRSVVAERLRGLERDLAEVRTRVNGLLFVVAGAVITQLLFRLLG